MAQLAIMMGGPMGLLKLGLFAASVVGSFLFQNKQEPQGKLNDLKVSSSAYGQGIAWVWGTMRVPGNMIWATDFEEEKRRVGGKGGGKGK